MATFQTVARLADIPNGQAYRVVVGEREIAIWNVNGTLYAIGDICTHEDAYLSEGELMPDCRVMCPLHGAEFDLRTGKALCLPATAPVETFPVQVVDGAVQVEI